MQHKVIMALFIGLIFSFGQVATANSKKSKTKLKKSRVKKKSSKSAEEKNFLFRNIGNNARSPFGLNFTGNVSSNFTNPSSPDNRSSANLGFYPSYRLDNGVTLIGSLSGTKNFQGEREFLLDDSYLGAIKSIYSQGNFSVLGQALTFIPFSELSKSRSRRSSFFVAPILTYRVANLRGLTLDFRPAGRFHINRFEQASNGESNTRYSLDGRFRIHYSFMDNLRMILSNTYSRGFTYEGNTRDTYSFGQVFIYTLRPGTDLALGHILGGVPLSPNGKEADIQLFDSRTSTIYSEFSYNF